MVELLVEAMTIEQADKLVLIRKGFQGRDALALLGRWASAATISVRFSSSHLSVPTLLVSGRNDVTRRPAMTLTFSMISVLCRAANSFWFAIIFVFPMRSALTARLCGLRNIRRSVCRKRHANP